MPLPVIERRRADKIPPAQKAIVDALRLACQKAKDAGGTDDEVISSAVFALYVVAKEQRVSPITQLVEAVHQLISENEPETVAGPQGAA